MFLGGPMGRWLVIGLVAVVAMFAAYQKGSASGYKDAADEIHASYRAQEQAWLAAMGRKQAALNSLMAKFDKRTAELEKELQGKERERLDALKKLRERIPNVQACVGDRITVHYVRLRNDAADWANGVTDNPPGAEAGTEPADAPSDVSSRELNAADIDQAGAFRACRDRVEGWEKYRQEVEAWSAEVNRVMGQQ